MHRRRLDAGAKMMPAGIWQRPPTTASPASGKIPCRPKPCTYADKVGIIDISTLGGLDVRGPDAAELLNRMYTFAFLKQPIGRSRYALMTNEHGVVIDDGVLCALGENHFYVTATTSGVDPHLSANAEVERAMAAERRHRQRHRLRISAVNVAADSRKVLEKVSATI